MARRSVPPPKPRAPILSAGQKRRRIERLQKCITSLEAFESQKVRKRFGNPDVIALEALNLHSMTRSAKGTRPSCATT